MKKLFLIVIASFLGAGAYAQTETPVKWYSNNTRTLNCTEEAVSLKVSIRSGWHINSLHVGNTAPYKTSFELSPPNQYRTKGTVMAPALFSKFENAFNSTVTYFEGQAVLKPGITWKSPKAINVSDKLNSIPWNNKKHPLPPTIGFIIPADK
ncbi:hypothetical protein [Mucilaginibacter lappiensis]|uniref:hypothetical protein n=1 Tax=Mucilaginibacter lappiensis TaxID=354630 RepID=UPI003D212159